MKQNQNTCGDTHMNRYMHGMITDKKREELGMHAKRNQEQLQPLNKISAATLSGAAVMAVKLNCKYHSYDSRYKPSQAENFSIKTLFSLCILAKAFS